MYSANLSDKVCVHPRHSVKLKFPVAQNYVAENFSRLATAQKHFGGKNCWIGSFAEQFGHILSNLPKVSAANVLYYLMVSV